MSVGFAGPEQLLERASRLAGLADFGPDVTPALAAFCEMFGELPLTAAGRHNLEIRATQALITRLRWVRARQQTPQLFLQQLLQDPIVIVGLPRAGTSYLQQLLSCLPGRRCLRFWEAREPIPDSDDQRIAYYGHVAALKMQAMPELAVQHPIDPSGPEECMFLLDPSLTSLSFVMSDAPCPRYLKWILDGSHDEPYALYRDLLLYLQAQAPGERFVLKSPAHFGMLSALRGAIPGARLVHIHRDPVQVLPSVCSLYETLSRGSLEAFEREVQGRLSLMFLERIITRNAEQRSQLPDTACFDMRFQEFTSDPAASVRRLHEHFGFDWSDADEQALAAEVARGAPPQVGRHRYRLEDYGLQAAEVAERLQTYRQRWGFEAD